MKPEHPKQFYTWPEFWHKFGNKWPTKSTEPHHRGHPFQSDYFNEFCFYCGLEELSDSAWFSDAGVKLTSGFSWLKGEKNEKQERANI